LWKNKQKINKYNKSSKLTTTAPECKSHVDGLCKKKLRIVATKLLIIILY